MGAMTGDRRVTGFCRMFVFVGEVPLAAAEGDRERTPLARAEELLTAKVE